jgi:hypothetical protein
MGISAPAISDDKPVTLENIIEVWKAREQNTKSFDFHWSARRFEDGETGLFAMNARMAAVRDRAAVRDLWVFPQIPDAKFIINYRYVSDAKGRIRVEESGQEWSTEKSSLVPRIHLEVFDGANRRSLFLASASGTPSDHVWSDSNAVGKLVWLHPVNMVYRPFSKSGGVFDEKTIALTTEKADLGGQPMLVLSDAACQVWVDPTRDFVPVRYLVVRNGATEWQMDLSFTHDHECGWIPRLWTINLADPAGKPRITESAKVLEYTLNKPIENSEFDTDLDRELAKTK